MGTVGVREQVGEEPGDWRQEDLGDGEWKALAAGRGWEPWGGRGASWGRQHQSTSSPIPRT